MDGAVMYLRICSLIALRRSPFRFDATVFRRPAASVRFQIFSRLHRDSKAALSGLLLIC